MITEPLHEVRDFAYGLIGAAGHGVAFYREDGREVLVEIQVTDPAGKVLPPEIYRFEAGEEFAHVTGVEWKVAREEAAN